MKAVLIDPTTPEELEFNRAFCPSVTLTAPVTDDSEELLHLLPGARAIVSKRRTVDGSLMDAAGKSLELVHLWSGRHDRVALPDAAGRGLTVSLTTQIGCVAVAELAITMMLGLSKKVVRAHDDVVQGRYRDLGVEPILTAERKIKFQWMQLPNLFEVHGLTLGLIGMGEIATEVARRAIAFGMRVVYWNRRRLPDDFETEEGIEYRDLERLLAESDFVSIHTPHTNDTEKLLNAERLKMMKPTAFVINTARGGIIDETALIDALRDGTIAGAGLDVFTYEPTPFDNPLLQLQGMNLMLMPHIGGGSGGTRMKQARDTLANLERLATGQALQQVILEGRAR
jgi:lactate dehydrogenase-like 2-hydroxyacid dehydrogenase